MPSVSLEIPAAIILLGGGLLACFLGYRLFRVLLAVYGFIAGALTARLVIESLALWSALVLTVAGGLVGTLLFLAAYLAGVALVGAALGALIAHVAWTPLRGAPETWVVIAACFAGALIAIILRRYVIIVGTSFAGAWTTLVGALALVGHSAATAAASGDLWGVYPMAPARGQMAFAIGWFGLGLTSTLVQLSSTARARPPKKK